MRITYFAIFLFVALSAFTAQAQTTIETLPSKGMVSLEGSVADVKDERRFVLRDNNGTIDVIVPRDESLVLKSGDEVTVHGRVESPFFGLFGKNIAATKVEVHKDVATVFSEMVTAATGLSLDTVKTQQIGSLPDQGMVKLAGTVEKVKDKKHFLLKDATGMIDVAIQSDDNVIVNKGAQVTVIGYVKKSLLSRKLNATRVLLMSPTPG